MQYYTLEEAAKLLNISPDELKKMAERNELRPFRDGRGAMRFRGNEVEEVARKRGVSSDPQLKLGEAPRPRPSDSPRPQKAPADAGVFDFALPPEDEQAPIGQDIVPPTAGGSSRSGRKLVGPATPPPKPGSDSDVRLVAEESGDDFQVASDSDVKLVEESGPVIAPLSDRSKKGPGSGKRRDSDVRSLDRDSDSDVRLTESDEAVLGQQPPKRKSDSDVRLEELPGRKGKSGPGSSAGVRRSPADMLTEEIDLDAEMRKAAEADKTKGQKPRTRHKPAPQLPTTSPFELSEEDLDVPGSKKAAVEDDSSDFDLSPASPAEESPIELRSDEIPAPTLESDDEVGLGELGGGTGKSGINLADPADSGISLEQSGSSDEVDFGLALADEPRTPKPAPAAGTDSDSEFELTLDSPVEAAGADDGMASLTADSDSEFELAVDSSSPAESSDLSADSDSEFELSVDADSSSPADSGSESEFELNIDSEGLLQAGKGGESDSEFELTLDDSGNLAPLDEEAAPAAEESTEGEADIFETDFEVPALDEESGSEAVALEESDTDLESSDFDMALGEEDSSAEEESGSQVVALEDEEAVDTGEETVSREGRRKRAAVDEAEADELLEEGEEAAEMDFDVSGEDELEADEEEAPVPRGRGRAAAPTAAAPPAEWGAMPALVLFPCVIVMFVVCLMGYELIHGMWGYRQPSRVASMVIDPLARMFTEDLPKD